MIYRPELALATVARLVARTVKGVGNDIKKPGQDEIAYDRLPLRAVNELGKLLRAADRGLPSMTLSLLVFSSLQDHTVKRANSRRIMRRAASIAKEMVPLSNSFHVATLDYDAELVFERTLDFARSLAERVASP
jgi:carboxylesterase